MKRVVRERRESMYLGGERFASPHEVEMREWTFYINYLRPGMIVFDVGAYIGELTLLFSRFVGEKGQVHAFEASYKNFEKLKIMCELAGRRNVILNHLALIDREGIVKLHMYDEKHRSWNSLATRPLQKYGLAVKPIGTEEVRATTIDIYCKKTGLSYIDLLKIDVEGAEYQVLLGARHMLESKAIHCCVFEFGKTTFDMGNNPHEIETYLRQFGYRLRNIVRGDPVFPGRSSAEMAQFSMHILMPKR
jgi:FkbM family methyltransferase